MYNDFNGSKYATHYKVVQRCLWSDFSIERVNSVLVALQFQIFPSAFFIFAWNRSKIFSMLFAVTQRFAILSSCSSSEIGRSQNLVKATATAQLST
jgi:hypothetical protein